MYDACYTGGTKHFLAFFFRRTAVLSPKSSEQDEYNTKYCFADIYIHIHECFCIPRPCFFFRRDFASSFSFLGIRFLGDWFRSLSYVRYGASEIECAPPMVHTTVKTPPTKEVTLFWRITFSEFSGITQYRRKFNFFFRICLVFILPRPYT